LWQVFEDHVLKRAASSRKHVILWQDPLDEGLELPVNTTIQVWKGSEDVARISALGHRVIVSSAEAWYLDCGHGSWVDGGRSWCDPYKVILKSPLCSCFI
jgi:hexosaminidase